MRVVHNVRRASEWTRSRAFVRRAARSRLWRSDIVKGVLTTLVVITITGVFSPAQFAKSSFEDLTGIFHSGPSTETREIEAFYEKVQHSHSWRSPPMLSGAGRSFLERHWQNLRPNIEHSFLHRPAKWRSLDEVSEQTSLDGHALLMSGFVDETYGVVPVPGQPKMVEEAFRLSTGNSKTVGWCAPMVFPRGKEPVVDQLVEIKGTVVARGDKPTAEGGFIGGSFMICSAAHALTTADASTEVASLFKGAEENALWKRPPSVSDSGRMYLLYHWNSATPLRPHSFPNVTMRRMGIGALLSDRRFDDGEILVSGYVTQRSLDTAYEGTIHENLRLEVGGQDGAVWCEATLQSRRVIQEGQYVEAVAVPLARGTASVSSGGFQGIALLACPAVRAY